MIGDPEILIVGGGPAGMVAGLLFARAGVRTLVLEKHGDFLRDFRGDTVHPSTMRLFSELGLLDRLLERPHDKLRAPTALISGRRGQAPDLFAGFDPRWNFLALMPQWEFLDFVAQEATRYPTFALRMNAGASDLVWDGERVAGVACDGSEVRAKLVIAADGRGSVLRERAGLKVRSFGAPMDVFWFSLPKEPTSANMTTGVIAAGRILALLDRGDYWQAAYIFGKGQAEAVHARGLEALRAEVARIAPPVADAVSALTSWDQFKMLTVKLDRLERWHRPGLLVIGDAAHAMSPVGGVGINVAIQDAVAAVNILAGPMAQGHDPDPLLAAVQSRRMLPVRLTQAFQNEVQKRVIRRVLDRPEQPFRPPLLARWFFRFAWFRRIPVAFLAFGVRAEHIRSPDAFARV